MKSTELKKLIKKAVKEAIQEELKDILLEALKPSPKNQTITESKNIDVVNNPPSLDSKQKYADILNEMTMDFSSKDVQKFNPQGSMDTTSPSGQLPTGEVGMDQIVGLMKGS